MLIATALALIAAVLLVCALVARVRATALPRSIVVEYSPIQPPARSADVVDDAILAGRERRAVAAGLLQLATTGAVRLVADTGPRGRAAVGVELVDGADLTPAGAELLEALFGPGHPRERVRRFSKDRRAVARRVRAYVDRRAAVLARRGLLSPRVTRARLTVRVAAVLLLMIAVPAAALTLVAGVWAPGIVCALAVLLLALALWIVPPGERRAPTPDAEPRRTHLDGLRQYLTLAETDRLRVLQSPSGALTRQGPVETFLLHEKLLPWAVVFGVERAWLAHLKIAYDELDATSLSALGEVAASTLDILQVADALGGLVEIGFAVGDLIGAGGDALDIAGGVFDALP
ncbi:MAG: DUF2207 domain-containing protein [Microbacterium sp.]|uniref:DUF2207 family protein n=1 Tax=Microbacterium sp. TaxID=51671 RepID=UPI001AD1004B|nr:DUF2207 domain-containing protein [Microbacterium sp.]MBN9177253.1 DUF2207 domain-containing protein [Microbacterium sp.]